MKKSQYELQVLINGKPVREYVKDGRVFVEAKSGSSYSLKIKNNTWGRVMAVISVDGIDVLKGKSAADADSGYVIGGQGHLEIKGFRVDNEREATFKFLEKGSGKGYAEIKGDSSSVGVIGVRIYSERVTLIRNTPVYVDRPVFIDRPVYIDRPYRYDYSYNAGPICSAMDESFGDISGMCNCSNTTLDSSVNDGAPVKRPMNFRSVRDGDNSAVNFMKVTNQDVEKSPMGFDMTTEWGKSVESKVTTVSFDRGPLSAQIEILYASRESLAEMGIKFDSIPEVAIPSAFNSKLNFCQPPVDWKG